MCVSGIIHLSATLSPPTHSLQGTMAEGLNEKCSSPSSCDTSDTRSVTIIPHRHKKVQKKLYGYLLLVGGIPTLLKKYESQSGWLFPTYGKNVPNHQPDWLFIGYWYRICFSILCIVVPLNPNGPPLGIPRSYLQWDPLRWLGAPNFPASAANARAGMVASKPIGTAGDLPSSNWTGLTGFVIHIITKNWHETSNQNETISAISQTSKMYQKVIGCISFMPRYCWYSWMPMAQVYPPFPTLQSLESWYLYIYIYIYVNITYNITYNII